MSKLRFYSVGRSVCYSVGTEHLAQSLLSLEYAHADSLGSNTE